MKTDNNKRLQSFVNEKFIVGMRLSFRIGIWYHQITHSFFFILTNLEFEKEFEIWLLALKTCWILQIENAWMICLFRTCQKDSFFCWIVQQNLLPYSWCKRRRKTKTKKILQAAIFYLVMLSTDAKMQNDRSTDSHHHALLNTEQIVVIYSLNCQLGILSSMHNSIT